MTEEDSVMIIFELVRKLKQVKFLGFHIMVTCIHVVVTLRLHWHTVLEAIVAALDFVA